jgi:predicted histone-like DNA-binding protein
MAVSFKLVAKQNNLVSPPEVKFYPCAVSKGTVNLDDLARVVASRSTVSRADCYGVIIGLTAAIADALADGRIVKIDELGTFQITLQGTAAESENDLGKSAIKAAKLVYRPSNDIKKRLKRIDFKRLR